MLNTNTIIEKMIMCSEPINSVVSAVTGVVECIKIAKEWRDGSQEKQLLLKILEHMNQ